MKSKKYKGFWLPAGPDRLQIFRNPRNSSKFHVNSQILEISLEESRDSAPRAGKIIESVESEVLQKLISGRFRTVKNVFVGMDHFEVADCAMF